MHAAFWPPPARSAPIDAPRAFVRHVPRRHPARAAPARRARLLRPLRRVPVGNACMRIARCRATGSGSSLAAAALVIDTTRSSPAGGAERTRINDHAFGPGSPIGPTLGCAPCRGRGRQRLWSGAALFPGLVQSAPNVVGVTITVPASTSLTRTSGKPTVTDALWRQASTIWSRSSEAPAANCLVTIATSAGCAVR